MDRKTKIYNIIFVALFVSFIVWYLKVRVTTTASSASTSSNISDMPREERKPLVVKQRNNDLIDRDLIVKANQRLSQLKADLNSLLEQERTSRELDQQTDEISAQIQTLQSEIEGNEANAYQMNGNYQTVQREVQLQKNENVAALELQLQNIDNLLITISVQAQQLRTLASVQDPLNPQQFSTGELEQQMAELQIQKSMLNTQIRLAELSSNSQALEVAQQYQEEEMGIQEERNEKVKSLNQLRTSLNQLLSKRIQPQAKRVLIQKIQALQSQIDIQEREVISLSR